MAVPAFFTQRTLEPWWMFVQLFLWRIGRHPETVQSEKTKNWGLASPTHSCATQGVGGPLPHSGSLWREQHMSTPSVDTSIVPPPPLVLFMHYSSRFSPQKWGCHTALSEDSWEGDLEPLCPLDFGNIGILDVRWIKRSFFPLPGGLLTLFGDGPALSQRAMLRRMLWFQFASPLLVPGISLPELRECKHFLVQELKTISLAPERGKRSLPIDMTLNSYLEK